ncbi:MAG TPA: hypothetical protein DHW02_02200, partial [Ktedonobacter sp.]|nr:hypothetical protein [Ktedonobacter sp.]
MRKEEFCWQAKVESRKKSAHFKEEEKFFMRTKLIHLHLTRRWSGRLALSILILTTMLFMTTNSPS